jgi:hypothetical protein
MTEATTELETDYQLRLAVLSTSYPRHLRSASTQDYGFWEGTEEDRTFYVASNERGTYLVVPDSDPRHLGMWPGDESGYPMPAGHYGWHVELEMIERFDDTRTLEELADSEGVEDSRTWGELSDQVEELTKTEASLLRQIEELRRELDLRSNSHYNDIKLIGEQLLHEAEVRDWCSEYDQTIDRLNGVLSVTLPIREKNYEVDVVITHRTTVSVTARDEESAEHLALDTWNNNDIQWDSPENVESDGISEVD